MEVAGALSKLVATLVINLFTISVVGYYTIRATTLKVKFSIPTRLGPSKEDTLNVGDQQTLQISLHK